jgi:hypothetical protein
MATQRTSVKVTKVIEISTEEIERILLKHFTDGIGDVTFDISSGGFFKGAMIVSAVEESNKTVEL